MRKPHPKDIDQAERACRKLTGHVALHPEFRGAGEAETHPDGETAQVIIPMRFGNLGGDLFNQETRLLNGTGTALLRTAAQMAAREQGLRIGPDDIITGTRQKEMRNSRGEPTGDLLALAGYIVRP